MSKKAAEHHRKASEHHGHAARHHEQPSIMKAGNTRKPPITLTLPAVTRATLAITLTTPAKRILRSTGRNSLVDEAFARPAGFGGAMHCA